MNLTGKKKRNQCEQLPSEKKYLSEVNIKATVTTGTQQHWKRSVAFVCWLLCMKTFSYLCRSLARWLDRGLPEIESTIQRWWKMRMERNRGEEVNSTISPCRCEFNQMMSGRNDSLLVMERNANDSVIYLVDVGLVSTHAWRDCSAGLCIVVATKISLDSFVDATNRARNTRRSRRNVAERPFPIAENDNRG